LVALLVCVIGFSLLPAAPSAVHAQGGTSADLVVSKSGDNTAPLGGQIAYNIVVTNAGPDTATNVVLTDPIPAHTTFVNASVSQGTVMFDGTTVTANFGTILAFESASLTLTVSVNSDTPRGTTISNTASVTSDTPDPDTTNNSSTADTIVTGPFPGDVLISEFRFRGPGGTNDEFVEICNNTNNDIVVSDPFGGVGATACASCRAAQAVQLASGWALVSSDDTATPKFVIPDGTVIPAHGHYLGVNSVGYSLNGYPAGTTINAVGDITYSADIPDNAGIALFRTADPSNFNAANRLDAVGFSAVTNPLYREGSGLGLPVTSGVEHSFLRRLRSAPPQDSDDNLADFVLVATDGNATLAAAQLGAPGPENLFSPTQHTDNFGSALIEPTLPSSQPPNRVRQGSGNSGTLSIRHRWTNNTGNTVERLRFRIVDITTLNTPIAIAPQADLRLVTSDDFTTTTSLGTLTVKGTILEEPPAQPIGGGLNSTIFVPLPPGGLAPGDSINTQFMTNVAKAGTFRIFVVVEPVLTNSIVASSQKLKPGTGKASKKSLSK
jgi:uncharacterized repeat protein (TIGR01451 family)